MSDKSTLPAEGHDPMRVVRDRIRSKVADYKGYGFNIAQSRAMNIFFDLAQEFDETEKVYALSTLVLRVIFSYDAEFYLCGEDSLLHLVSPPARSTSSAHLDRANTPELGPHSQHGDGYCLIPELDPHLRREDGYCLIPVFDRGHHKDPTHPLAENPAQSAPDAKPGDPAFENSSATPAKGQDSANLLGVLAVRERKPLARHELLFLQKYANRLGYCLDNKRMAKRNAKHLFFLRKLAGDIGHNIITPNIRLKRQLRLFRIRIDQLNEHLNAIADINPVILHDLHILHGSMIDQFEQINAGFSNGALFMESLLRQSHFDLGRYVLRNSRLDLGKMIVIPQFERYRDLFAEREVLLEPDHPLLPAGPCYVTADHGLISQVLANLLSNAAKYAALPAGAASPVKPVVRCTLETDAKAAKVTVFSTGGHISPADAARLFDDNFRAANSTGREGVGHGLFFVSQIMEAHKGQAGYEPAPGGNNFYFRLPLADEQ
ncbi:MAG: HAMP domain-containing histidine kinase [Desulfovibrio sp.]|jgi:signal transduction histidine kinase|nr:HAMP domain-containing histidine kinase [Desulfovibrio sp.]